MTTETKQLTEAEKLFVDLDKPSLHALSYALRHPDTWPEGFVWDYQYCQQCAMGLAHQLWGKIPSLDHPLSQQKVALTEIAKSFAMPYGKAKDIFMGGSPSYPYKMKTEGFLWWKRQVRGKVDVKAITPEMVADQVDLYLATVE